MANTNGLAGDMIGKVYTKLANQLETFADQSNKFYMIIKALKDGELTLDRIQVLENQEDVKILPPIPTKSTEV